MRETPESLLAELESRDAWVNRMLDHLKYISKNGETTSEFARFLLRKTLGITGKGKDILMNWLDVIQSEGDSGTENPYKGNWDINLSFKPNTIWYEGAVFDQLGEKDKSRYIDRSIIRTDLEEPNRYKKVQPLITNLIKQSFRKFSDSEYANIIIDKKTKKPVFKGVKKRLSRNEIKLEDKLLKTKTKLEELSRYDPHHEFDNTAKELIRLESELQSTAEERRESSEIRFVFLKDQQKSEYGFFDIKYKDVIKILTNKNYDFLRKVFTEGMSNLPVNQLGKTFFEGVNIEVKDLDDWYKEKKDSSPPILTISLTNEDDKKLNSLKTSPLLFLHDPRIGAQVIINTFEEEKEQFVGKNVLTPLNIYSNFAHTSVDGLVGLNFLSDAISPLAYNKSKPIETEKIDGLMRKFNQIPEYRYFVNHDYNDKLNNLENIQLEFQQKSFSNKACLSFAEFLGFYEIKDQYLISPLLLEVINKFKKKFPDKEKPANIWFYLLGLLSQSKVAPFTPIAPKPKETTDQFGHNNRIEVATFGNVLFEPIQKIIDFYDWNMKNTTNQKSLPSKEAKDLLDDFIIHKTHFLKAIEWAKLGKGSATYFAGLAHKYRNFIQGVSDKIAGQISVQLTGLRQASSIGLTPKPLVDFADLSFTSANSKSVANSWGLVDNKLVSRWHLDDPLLILEAIDLTYKKESSLLKHEMKIAIDYFIKSEKKYSNLLPQIDSWLNKKQIKMNGKNYNNIQEIIVEAGKNGQTRKETIDLAQAIIDVYLKTVQNLGKKTEEGIDLKVHRSLMTQNISTLMEINTRRSILATVKVAHVLSQLYDQVNNDQDLKPVPQREFGGNILVDKIDQQIKKEEEAIKIQERKIGIYQ